MTLKLEKENEYDVSPEDVKQYLAEEAAEPKESDTSSDTTQDTLQPDTQTNDRVEFNFEADPAFRNSLKVEEAKKITATLGIHEVEVTPADQRMYLKAMLNDVPVTLDIPVMGGQVTVTCRALSVFETEKVVTMAIKYFQDNPEVPAMLMSDHIQQMRVLLQVVSINKVPFNGHKPLKENTTDEDMQMEDFRNASWHAIRNMNITKYNMLVQALNVFETKLARMNSASLNGDFWHPGETD